MMQYAKAIYQIVHKTTLANILRASTVYFNISNFNITIKIEALETFLCNLDGFGGKVNACVMCTVLSKTLSGGSNPTSYFQDMFILPLWEIRKLQNMWFNKILFFGYF